MLLGKLITLGPITSSDGQIRKVNVGVEASFGESKTKATDSSTNRFLTNELYFEFMDSFLGKVVMVLVFHMSNLYSDPDCCSTET